MWAFLENNRLFSKKNHIFRIAPSRCVIGIIEAFDVIVEGGLNTGKLLGPMSSLAMVEEEVKSIPKFEFPATLALYMMLNKIYVSLDSVRR